MTATETRMDGVKIEVSGHDSGYGQYAPASFVVVRGRAYAIATNSGPSIGSGDQYAAARAYAAGKSHRLGVRAADDVDVRVRDRDGIGCRLTCYLPGTDMEVGYSDTTDRGLLAV